MQKMFQFRVENESIIHYPVFFFRLISLADKEVPLGHHSSNKLLNAERASLVTWEPYYCVLLQDDQTFTAYRSEEMAVSSIFHLFFEPPSPYIQTFAAKLFYLFDTLT